MHSCKYLRNPHNILSGADTGACMFHRYTRITETPGRISLAYHAPSLVCITGTE